MERKKKQNGAIRMQDSNNKQGGQNGVTEKMTFTERSKEKNHVDMQGNKFPCRGNCECKEPEGVCLASLRKSWGPGWLQWSEGGDSRRR